MHALAAAQLAVVSASLSSSASSFFSPASAFFFFPICSRESSLKLSQLHLPLRASTSTPENLTLVVGTGLRTGNAYFLAHSGNSLGEVFRGVRGKKRMSIRNFASRKDRREIESGDSLKLEPDIAALKAGFLKKFPSSDSSKFLYDWDDLEDDDGDDDDVVEVKSFKSGSHGRARLSSSPNSAREGYNHTPGIKPDSFSSRGKPATASRGEIFSGRRASQSTDREGAKAQGLRSQKGAAGQSKERDNVEGARRNPGVYRENSMGASTSKNFREGERNSGTGLNGKPSEVRRGREPYGGGEWSKDTPVFDEEEEKKKRKKAVIEPVRFTSPFSRDPHVAILGGGMSGLVCALRLEEHGIQSTVFDTGKHGLGGRMGTRHVDEHNGAKLVFDHAAQFFTVTDARFQKLVDGWVSEGAVNEWTGSVGTLQAGGHYAELPPATRYIGTNGMRSLADRMLSKSQRITVKRPCWISSMEALNGSWKLTENRKPQGEFDAVVIAHNGKCANRLLSTAHVPLIARQMKRLELSSIWALLAAFKEPLPLPGSKPFDGAFVSGVDSLSWMGNNSSKLVLPNDDAPQCWTFFSSAAYGKKHKVPQESIPIAKGQRVKNDMLAGVAAALGVTQDSLPSPVYSRLQLWGAALPTNTPGVPCIFDAHGRVGICGDWLLGSSLEAAALSGMALADQIAKYRDQESDDGEDFSVGLQQIFSSVNGHDIGQFPGIEELPKQAAKEVLTVV